MRSQVSKFIVKFCAQSRPVSNYYVQIRYSAIKAKETVIESKAGKLELQNRRRLRISIPFQVKRKIYKPLFSRKFIPFIIT